MTQPWMKFYPADWRADPRLRMCSLAARGLWADMLCYMHEGQPYGHFTIDGHQPDNNEIAALVARPVSEVKKALAELEARQVFSRAESGSIYSRRMVRDKAKAEKDRENGKAGGNPSLKAGVNPPDKAQKPEARSQIPEVRVSGFKGTGEVVKRDTPPPHGILSKKNGRIFISAKSQDWASYAEDYKRAHGEYPRPNEHGGKWFKILGENAA